ncbi:PucR family transcriptional regulator [Desulfitobacterium hafniense]|uniref:PucR family transcriptional regulator n=1 Tax=Desulfitobacterium hafniense TaxID=49338 RepID=UPI00036BD779|nr:helix-turn-helix domain-containing protein [Desulfitobacterium hafniense]
MSEQSSSSWMERMALVQAGRGGLPGLCRLLAEEIGLPVFVTDIEGRVFCWQSFGRFDITPEEKVFLPSTVQKSTGKSEGILTLRGQKYSFYCWSIKSVRTVGYLWILGSLGDLSTVQLDKIEGMRWAMLVEISKKLEQLEWEQYLKDQLVQDLIFNNFDGLDTIFRKAQLWGWDFARSHCVVVFEGKTMGREYELSHLRILVENLLKEKYPGAALGVLGNYLVGLLPWQGKSDPNGVVKDVVYREVSGKGLGNGGWQAMIREVFAELKKELPSVTLRAGVGKIHESTEMLYRSYQEAKVALELGKLIRNTSGLILFEELGAVRLFYNQREQDLQDFFTEVLGPVVHYDKQNEGNLITTLWQYFLARGDTAKAVANLYIHANTLRYRLRKVEELIGSSLDDQETRFNVYAAMKVGILLGRFEPEIAR